MYRSIAIVAFCVIVASTYAAEVEWTRTYGGELGDYGVKIIQTRDGGYAFLGKTFSFAEGNDDYFLLKLDSDGDTIWTKTYGGPEGVSPRDIIQTSDAGYVLAGGNANQGIENYLFVLRVDEFGDSVWATSLGYKGSANAICELPTSYALVGFSKTTDNIVQGIVAALSPSGDSLWTAVYGDALLPEIVTVVFTDAVTLEGDIIAVGTQYNETALESQILLTRIDPNGDEIWTTRLGESGNSYASSIASIGDSVLILGGGLNSGDGFIIGVDPDGDSLWTVILDDSLSSGVNSICATSDGGFAANMFVAFTTPQPEYISRIIRFNGSRDVLWSLTFDSLYDETGIESITQTRAGGFVIGGYAHVEGIDVDMYVSKIETETIHVSALQVEGATDSMHISSRPPTFVWTWVDPNANGQALYEIELGIDPLWCESPVWSSGTAVSSSNSCPYDGAELTNGQIYFVRLRVSSGPAWSPWYETTFRMNTPPEQPVPLSPIDWTTADGLVTLWFTNAFDAETDPLIYDITGFHDTDCVFGRPIDTSGVPEGADSTGVFYDLTLSEDCFYCWRVRAFDGYEYGNWTAMECFHVDDIPEPPTAPEPIYPVNPEFGVLYDMTPQFLWARGLDGDPGDSVWHRLEVALDRNFAFVQTVDSLRDNRYTLPDSLAFDERYWWRVTAFDMDGFETVSPAESLWTWTLGDIDRSHTVSLGDLTALIDCLFISLDPILPPRLGDLDGSCTISLGDLTVMIDHLFISLNPLTTVGCDPPKE